MGGKGTLEYMRRGVFVQRSKTTSEYINEKLSRVMVKTHTMTLMTVEKSLSCPHTHVTRFLTAAQYVEQTTRLCLYM